jgi:hypothetical protein
MKSRAQDTFVGRYKGGEHDAVWRDLRRIKKLDATTYEEALSVAKLTMKAVKHNAGIVAGRLEARGWKALSGELLCAPDRTADQKTMKKPRRVFCFDAKVFRSHTPAACALSQSSRTWRRAALVRELL